MKITKLSQIQNFRVILNNIEHQVSLNTVYAGDVNGSIDNIMFVPKIENESIKKIISDIIYKQANDLQEVSNISVNNNVIFNDDKDYVKLLKVLGGLGIPCTLEEIRSSELTNANGEYIKTFCIYLPKKAITFDE